MISSCWPGFCMTSVCEDSRIMRTQISALYKSQIVLDWVQDLSGHDIPRVSAY